MKIPYIQRMGMSARYARIPGVTVGFSQPMIDGVNDKISGAHSDLVVKVFGHDFGELRRIATDVVRLEAGRVAAVGGKELLEADDADALA